jgi:hypothetical protein
MAIRFLSFGNRSFWFPRFLCIIKKIIHYGINDLIRGQRFNRTHYVE